RLRGRARPCRVRRTGPCGGLVRRRAGPGVEGNFLRLGFTEEDLADGGSDRLVDAVFAWGDENRVRERIDTFRAAGADHLALQVITSGSRDALPREEWRRLAALLD
ncbi:LLM class F420-dependent oxidoreductase, partial [Streptomyces sp. NPDC004561]